MTVTPITPDEKAARRAQLQAELSALDADAVHDTSLAGADQDIDGLATPAEPDVVNPQGEGPAPIEPTAPVMGVGNPDAGQPATNDEIAAARSAQPASPTTGLPVPPAADVPPADKPGWLDDIHAKLDKIIERL